MKLSNKYGVSQDTINQMVKDGVLSSKWPAYEEVYSMYLKLKETCRSKEEIYYIISDQKNIHKSTVRLMIETIAKI